MKKIITILTLLIIGFNNCAKSQVVSFVQPLATHAGVNDININFSNFSGASAVGSITLKIGFDSNVFSYSDVLSNSSFNGFNANVVGNEIIIAWSNTTPVSVSNSTVFTLQLSYIDGNCDLTFNEGCEIGNSIGNIITSEFTNLHILQAAGTIPTASIGTTPGVWSNGINDNELAIDFSNFTSNAGSFTFNISYDTSKLVFLDLIKSNNLSDAIANTSNGVIHISWASTTAVDMENFPTTFLKLKFNYLGGVSDVKFVGQNSISDGIGTQIPTHFTSTGGITLSNCSCEKTLSIDYGVEGNLSGFTSVLVAFNSTPSNIGSINLHIAYDNTALDFLGTDLPGMVSNANNGVIDLAWSNTGGGSFPGFDLSFNYIGGFSDLQFTGFNQISDLNGNPIPTYFVDGNVSSPSVINVNVKIADVPLPIAAPYTVDVPIDFTGSEVGLIHAATMYVDYDITKLDFIGIENAPTGVIANEDPITRTIIISWSNTSTALPLVASKFLDLKFAKGWWGGSSTTAHVGFTNFNSVSSSLGNSSGGSVLALWNAGTVSMLLPNYNADFIGEEFSGVNSSQGVDGFCCNVYPNPCYDYTIIAYSVVELSKVRISIYNSLGQKVEELRNDLENLGTYKLGYNVSKLDIGIYSCEILINNQISNYRKIIKLAKIK